jgi:hypothetical protein
MDAIARMLNAVARVVESSATASGVVVISTETARRACNQSNAIPDHS